MMEMAVRSGIKIAIPCWKRVDKRYLWTRNQLNQNNHATPPIHTGAKVFTTDNVKSLTEPNFRDTATIYASKNWPQLLRSFFVFSLCSWDIIVNNQLTILSWCRRLLGLRLFRLMMRSTIYGQFLAGEKEAEVLAVARKNAEVGLYPMFSYTAAEVHGDAKATKDISFVSSIHDINYNAVECGLRMAANSKEFSYIPPQFATKMTFFTFSEILCNLSMLLEENKTTLQKHLSTIDKAKSLEFREYLLTVLNSSSKNYAGSGLVTPSACTASELETSALVTNLAFNLELSKNRELSSFTKDETCKSPLSSAEEKTLLELWQKLCTLGQYSADQSIVFIMDAEQTYLQPAIECFTLDLMRRFNREKPVIHNTYQCYLERTFDVVTRDLDLARKEGFCLGLKVVRGAYIEEERSRARSLGYPDPVNPTYDATTAMYERVATHLLTSLNTLGPNRVHVTFATHNEDTVKFLLRKMGEVGIPRDCRNVGMAQLLGMRDHITFSLGEAGIPAAKLISYGVVEEGVRWLSRRVAEVSGTRDIASRERKLLRSEIKRRLLRR